MTDIFDTQEKHDEIWAVPNPPEYNLFRLTHSSGWGMPRFGVFVYRVEHGVRTEEGWWDEWVAFCAGRFLDADTGYPFEGSHWDRFKARYTCWAASTKELYGTYPEGHQFDEQQCDVMRWSGYCIGLNLHNMNFSGVSAGDPEVPTDLDGNFRGLNSWPDNWNEEDEAGHWSA